MKTYFPNNDNSPVSRFLKNIREYIASSIKKQGIKYFLKMFLLLITQLLSVIVVLMLYSIELSRADSTLFVIMPQIVADFFQYLNELDLIFNGFLEMLSVMFAASYVEWLVSGLIFKNISYKWNKDFLIFSNIVPVCFVVCLLIFRRPNSGGFLLGDLADGLVIMIGLERLGTVIIAFINRYLGKRFVNIFLVSFSIFTYLIFAYK